MLIVPLGIDEADSLTLAEMDALTESERVLFERPDHPLRDRLDAAGVATAPLADLSVEDGVTIVCDPDSARVKGWARDGAQVATMANSSPDALTRAAGSYASRRAATAFASLVEVMARLRGDDGCPWDREQDHRSLTVHLQEEAHEVIDAIESGKLGPELEDELGDLLLQVVFHAQMAADEERFDIGGVIDAIVAKLVRRHPHVFGEVSVSGSGEVLHNWEVIKEGERGGAEDSRIPPGLPALLAAYKTQKRAVRQGVSIGVDEARSKASIALGEDPDEETVGEALFWTVAMARSAHIDPEGALRRATARFTSTL